MSFLYAEIRLRRIFRRSFLFALIRTGLLPLAALGLRYPWLIAHDHEQKSPCIDFARSMQGLFCMRRTK